MEHLIRVLLCASEKSAHIARAWIAQKELFDLLVEEKKGEAKNQRFITDFKTLADVLVQEVVRHDVSKTFPELEGHILGEESNIFTNNQGKSISVQIQASAAETAKLLSEVLEGNICAAQILADIIHNDVTVDDDKIPQPSSARFDAGDFGIWIDPIDGTAEYMSRCGGVYENGLLSRGLPCVTILIGVFSYKTGQSVAGVVNQPFVKYDEKTQTWNGHRTWGSSVCGINMTSFGSLSLESSNNNNENTKISVVVSASESEEVLQRLQSAEIACFPMSTVGFKLLKVIDGTTNAYVLSKDSSFKWDTCAAHAILNALGGGVVPYRHAVRRFSELASVSDSVIIEELKKIELNYSEPDSQNFEFGKKWSNSDGLIAFRRYEDLLKIIKAVLSD